MFTNCCGCNSKKENSSKRKKERVIRNNDNSGETESKEQPKKFELTILSTIDEETEKSKENEVEPVVKQPPVSSTIEIKRQSVVSDIKIEISDNDDDEVFCEGVGPIIKLAENLGNPNSIGKAYVQLPKWFSEEDSQERGGIQEPPATPVGRDELALRRHRFFSELLDAAQHVNEHKVRFDPLGPRIAGAPTEFTELEAVVSRLEDITNRLESLYVTKELLTGNNSKQITPSSEDSTLALESERKETMSVQGFTDIIQGSLAQYLAISKQIGDDVATHSDIVKKAFQAQLNYLTIASQSKQPSSQSEQIALLQPTSEQITAIQEFREKNRTSKFFNHLSAISDSIPALGWVTISPAPAPYVKEMNDAGQFYTNRVLKDWKEKDKKHVDWVKAWTQTLTNLQTFVKQNHTTGLVWSGKNAPVVGSCAPPPPPDCPPPPPVLMDLPPASDEGTDRSALFAQINQGENITRSLKKVTDDMQTHKNPTLRQGPAPFKAPTSTAQVKAAGPIDKPPSFVRDGKKWLIEYQKSNHNLVVENAEMNNVVYVFRCTESTITVKGKLNSIILDSCKKTSVVFDALVSSIEFINCQSVQMQVFEKVPTISIDKTDGCQMYLSPQSLDVEIISSKSSEMNVMVPKGSGDYTEFPVPEQFKTTVSAQGKGLNTIVVESKG